MNALLLHEVGCFDKTFLAPAIAAIAAMSEGSFGMAGTSTLKSFNLRSNNLMLCSINSKYFESFNPIKHRYTALTK